MAIDDRSVSFYFFDVDDNLLILSTKLYLWNAETKSEQAISSSQFADIQGMLGRPGPWQSWAIGPNTFRDFNDQEGIPVGQQSFVRDVTAAAEGTAPWQGPSWPLLVHAAKMQRPVAIISARGHKPQTVEAGLQKLVSLGDLAAVPPILGIFTVTNSDVLKSLGITDPAMTIPSAKKIAIKAGVNLALQKHGFAPPHRFGMSDDDPANVVLAISAMRDCKLKYPDKRFFVINTNGKEFVKLEIFPMSDPVTARNHLLGGVPAASTGANGRSTGIRSAATSVYISNMDRAIEFYSEGLGLTLQSRIGNEWAELVTSSGVVIGLHPAQPPTTVAPGTIGAINLEFQTANDLESAISSLKSQGVPFLTDIKEYPHVRLITCSDPDGNRLFLAQPLP